MASFYILLSILITFAYATFGLNFDDFPVTIIKSQHNEISLIEVIDNVIVSEVLVVQSTAATYVDYDSSENCVYWANSANISRKCLNGNQPIESLVTYNIGRIDGLAFDWFTNILYFADSDRRRIEAVNVSLSDYGTTASRLRCTIVEYDLVPTQVVVDPDSRALYWIGWDQSPLDKRLLNASIFKTDLQVADFPINMILNDHIQYPDGFTIDYEKDRLYWNDRHLNYIGSCDTLGGNFRIEITHTANAITAGLSVYSDLIYYLHSRVKGYMNITAKDKGKHLFIIQENQFNVKNFKVFGPHKQFALHACGVPNANDCNNLCIVLHNLEYQCICYDGLTLNGKTNQCECPDSNDPQDCFKHARKCADTEFQCATDGKCIDRYLKCDRKSDCSDDSDELKCPKKCELVENGHHCNELFCLPNEWVCDGIPDCWSKSDELYCTWTEALTQYWNQYTWKIIGILLCILLVLIIVIAVLIRRACKQQKL